MKAIAIAVGIIMFVLLYAVVRAIDDADQAEWCALCAQQSAGCAS